MDRHSQTSNDITFRVRIIVIFKIKVIVRVRVRFRIRVIIKGSVRVENVEMMFYR